MALLTNINGKFSVSDAGAVRFNDAFTFPTADGDANYILKTNGSGQLAWGPDNNSGDITGSGTTNTVTKFTGAKVIGNGPITFATNDSTFAGSITGTRAFFNSGNTNVVATFTSTDGIAGIALVDDSGNVELAASGDNFQVQPAGGTAQLTVGSSASTFAGTLTATNYFSSTTAANIFLGSVITKPGDNLGFIVRNDSNAVIGSLLRTSNTASKLTADTLDLSGTTAQYVRGDGSFATFSPGTGTVTGTGSATRVAFWSSTSAISSDADLYWDNTNKRLGIGTASPSFQLSIENHATTSSIATFEIDGKRTNGTDGAVGEMIFSNNGDTFATVAGARDGADNSGSLLFQTQDSGTFGTRMIISSEGNVGIGTDSPTARLDVLTNSATGTNDIDRHVRFRADNGEQRFNFFVGRSGNSSNLQMHDSSEVVKIVLNTGDNSYFNGGNLGVGTTSPNFKLHVSGTGGADTLLRLENTTVNKYPNLRFSAAGAEYDIGVGGTGTATGYVHNFYVYDITNSAARITLTQAGNVGIGTQSPLAKLNVVGTGSGVGIRITGDPSTGGAYYYGIMHDGTNLRGTTQTNLLYTEGSVLANTTITDWASLRITNPSTAATGAVITNNYAIYQASNVQKNYFNGSVGIGTESPGRGLTIDKSNEFAALEIIKNNTTNQIVYLGTGSSAGTDDPILQLKHNGTEKIRLYATGNSWINGGRVAIGSTVAQYGVLEIQTESAVAYSPTVFTNGANIRLKSGGTSTTGTTTGISFGAGGACELYFGVEQQSSTLGHGVWQGYNGTAYVALMRLSHDGSLTVKGDLIAYGSPSDKKLKENIKPIKSALDKAMKLQGVTFDWKKSDSELNIKEDIGFIAQDVQKVIPELVRENEDGMLSMRHQGITPILLEAIKELKAEIEELKKHNCNCK